MKFHIVIVGRGTNVGAIDSAMQQTANKCVYVVCDDRGIDFVAGDAGQGKIIWCREKRMYAARNISDCINEFVLKSSNNDDVICLLDGDDKLIDKYSLEAVEEAYKDKNVWVTHGSYIKNSGHYGGFNGEYKSTANIRKDPWRASHLKTFRVGLWKHLPEDTFLDKDGEWLKVCSDTALMYPIIELASLKRVRFISKPIYLYNDLNPENDHKVSGVLQIETDKWIRNKNPLNKIDKY